jgi:hypothetical protein
MEELYPGRKLAGRSGQRMLGNLWFRLTPVSLFEEDPPGAVLQREVAAFPLRI